MHYRSLFESLRAMLYRITGSLLFLALDLYTEDVCHNILHYVIQEQMQIQGRNCITFYILKWNL